MLTYFLKSGCLGVDSNCRGRPHLENFSQEIITLCYITTHYYPVNIIIINFNTTPEITCMFVV